MSPSLHTLCSLQQVITTLGVPFRKSDHSYIKEHSICTPDSMECTAYLIQLLVQVLSAFGRGGACMGVLCCTAFPTQDPWSLRWCQSTDLCCLVIIASPGFQKNR